MKKQLVTIALKSIIPIGIIVLWEVLVAVDILPHQSIAPPSKALPAFFELLITSTYWKYIFISIYRLLTGFCLGGIFGITLGYLVGYNKTLSTILEPSILTLIPVPPMAWIPLLVALLGIGELTKIVLVSVGSFTVLFIATSSGVRATDKKILELAQVFKKTSKEITRQIIFPSALRYILSNLRIVMALSWTLLLASEIINASSGIGWFIWDSRRFYRADEMIVGIITIGILGKLSDFLLVKLQRYYSRWDTSITN